MLQAKTSIRGSYTVVSKPFHFQDCALAMEQCKQFGISTGVWC